MSILFSDIDATCSSLGFYENEKYFIENDVLRSLKHLIWILRHDNLDSHEYRRYMGHKKVLQTDLIPMLTGYCCDDELSDVLLRLIVNLTSPPELFFRADLPKSNTGRQNYLDLVEISYTSKSAFANSTEIWKVLVTRLRKLINMDLAIRTEDQSVTIERILIMTRNVLQVPSNPQSEKRVDNDLNVHDLILCALDESGMYEMILYILSSQYERKYYLHALELIYLIFREQNAEILACSSEKRSIIEKNIDEQALISARKNEKLKSKQNLPPARHSRFGGTYVYRHMKSVSENDLICHQPLEKVVNNDLSRNKKKAKNNFRLIRDDERYERQSAYSVRHFLHEFCIRILTSAFNNLIGQVKGLLSQNYTSDSALGHDQSYLLWAIHFFLQFNRFKGFQFEFVKMAMSIETIHWISTQIQHDAEMIETEKTKKLIWNRRLQLGIIAYCEILKNLQVMDQNENNNVIMMSEEIKFKIFNVSEYSEILLMLLFRYDEKNITRLCLRKLLEAVNIYLNMMEKFDVDDQEANGKKSREFQKEVPEKIVENLQCIWDEKVLPELANHFCEDDSLDDKTIRFFDIDSQLPNENLRKQCIENIREFLNEGEYKKAILLLKACRKFWSCAEFGTKGHIVDEVTVMRDIFMSVGGVTEEDDEDFWANFDKSGEDFGEQNQSNRSVATDDDEQQVSESFQIKRPFTDVEKRLINQKVIRACTFVLQKWESCTYREIKSTVTILHRIAVNQKHPIMLMQAQLFRIFQQVFDAPIDQRYEELRRLGIFITRKFIQIAIKNPKMYAELLFFKSIRECNDIENNYEDHHKESEGRNKVWLEHEEQELKKLYMMNQECPETDQDVIDWIIENLSEKSRTRREVVRKLKELGLIFKAPTKKSTAANVNRNLFIKDEDDKLYELFNEHRLSNNCLDNIMEVFHKKRSKNAVIKRMIQLGLVANESELMPIKVPKKKKKLEVREFSQSEDEQEMEEEKRERNENDDENDIGTCINYKISETDLSESDVISENEQSNHERERQMNFRSRKRQLLQSDSEDENDERILQNVQKKKVCRIIDSDND